MKRTNEEALELFADILEPAAEVLADKELADIIRGGGKPVKAVAVAIRKHKAEIIEILARIDGADPEEYEVNVLVLPVRLINLLNRPEIKELFTLQGQTGDAASSGSATENTGDGAI